MQVGGWMLTEANAHLLDDGSSKGAEQACIDVEYLVVGKLKLLTPRLICHHAADIVDQHSPAL